MKEAIGKLEKQVEALTNVVANQQRIISGLDAAIMLCLHNTKSLKVPKWGSIQEIASSPVNAKIQETMNNIRKVANEDTDK